MDEYDEWLQGMLVSLNDMNPLEQQGVLWEKRRALFGDAATQIWQEEISAEQERQITMRNTMEILDKAYHTSMQERLYLLQSTFEETYADKIQNMVIDPKGVLSQVFFGFDSVQQDLAKLPAEERQAQIDDIRRTMGFPEEQIKHLSESDQKREKRWLNGYEYMEARAEAEANYSGEVLAQELDKIREKYFAHEASTIKKEELFEGGIVKPDLETSLKELHPFAISIRQLSKRIGEDNVFLVVTHCGDDYVEKRDWCELIDVPPENVTFCQSSFVHALSEDYNKNKSHKFIYLSVKN